MSLESIPISRIMNADVKTDTEDQNVMSACKIMNDNKIGCVIIKGPQTGKPVGIITERDVVRILGKLEPSLLASPLGDLMTKPLITIDEISSVKDAMQFMNTNNIRRLVAINKEQQMVGIKTGKRNSISISGDFKTSIEKVFAAGDVTSGETLIVKAMEKGREAGQRVHEFLMNLESSHMSFYERYYENLSYDKMLKGEKEVDRPPD